jgi:hypothetical protein
MKICEICGNIYLYTLKRSLFEMEKWFITNRSVILFELGIKEFQGMKEVK